jgi:hypothetical protein
MRVALWPEDSSRSVSNLGRTICSGRGAGAFSLGLRMIRGGSVLESLEA